MPVMEMLSRDEGTEEVSQDEQMGTLFLHLLMLQLLMTEPQLAERTSMPFRTTQQLLVNLHS